MQNDQNPEPKEAVTPAVATIEFPEAETVYAEEFNDYEERLRIAIRERAKKDMLYGALWCVGGTVLTIADVGFIFWGAIIFGGIQFFRGLSNYNKA
ncbi:MAG: hypothetical protein V4592_18365 [Bacteroidota bacterium]